jgi:fucose 4-O-acetylase-like acetyltransferase
VADSPRRALRLPWLDLYKGLAILLVVLGHMNIPARASQLIYSFHVPLFFIASGYVMALGRQIPFRTYLARRWRTLILPYFVFSLVGLLALLLFLPQEADFRYTLTRSLLGILYGNGAASPKTVLTPLWFLTCLFSTELLFLGVQRLGRGRLAPMAALVAVLLGLGLLNAAVLRVPLPWGGHLAPVALAFFFVGYLCSRLALAPAILARRAAALGLSLSFLLWIGATLANARVDMNSNQYGQPLLFFASALSGAAMVYFVVQILQSRPGVAAVATYLGANSLVILAVHTLWPSVVRSLLGSLAPLAPAPLVPLLTSRIDMLLSLLLVWGSIEWINRRFPSLIGRRVMA